MQPNRLGRILGVGARVAAEKLREGTARAAAAAQKPGSLVAAAPRPVVASAESAPSLPKAPSSASMAEGGRRFARGAGRFSASLWKPFAHATGILWLQITGLFFAFFAVGFAAYSWQLWRSTRWHDRHLSLYAAFALLFAWFAVSSFWRANRRQKL